MMRSVTRGSVAGSSLAVKGISRSLASLLNPPVEPEKRRKWIVYISKWMDQIHRTSHKIEYEVERAIHALEDRMQLEFGVE